ncbi:MAG: hypothetical protein II135_09245 [Clostridia bacterium]|nr:hypothetical protein [Clostridia bacterium]
MMQTAKRILCVLISVLFVFSLVSGAAAAATASEPKTTLPGRIKRELKVLSFDFSEKTINAYVRNPYVEVVNYGVMKIANGVMSNQAARPFAFASSGGVGDDYGLSEGYVKFKMSLNSGETALGMRLPRVDAYKDCRGIWFSFSPDGKITVSEKVSGKSAVIDTKKSFAEPVQIKCEEKMTGLALYVNGNKAAEVDIAGAVTVKDLIGGEEVRFDKADVDPAGRFSLYMGGSTDGYIDDLEFTHYDVDQSGDGAEPREIDYSTWTAVDDLGRTVASNEKAGDPREGKYVGLFYFLCWTGAGVHVQDNTKIYLEQGADGLKKYLEQRGGEAYWAEPYFGYYRNTDKWVYRKHAYMFEAAGIDFIFLDVSNGVTFNEGHLALFDTWLQIRKEGGHTPQIVFFCGDRGDVLNTDVQNIRRTVFSEANYEKYKELFFMWEGKPLIFGNINAKEVTAQTKQFLSDFTVRGNWAWCDKNGYWSWLQDYKYNRSKDVYTLVDGGKGRDAKGNFEELAICLGHHASTSKGRSYVNTKEPNTKKDDFNYTLEGIGEGKCFEFQFNAAKSFDPQVLLITGWNEWIAGCFHDKSNTFFAQTNVNGYAYIDQFNTEFSRDAEPMRLRDGVGFGDNYYYQLCDYVRQFKGIGKTTEATGQKTVSLTDISSWDGVGPEYRDNTGDAELRNSVCYDADIRYINNTGRNDIEYAKVSQDKYSVFFLVKCTADIEKADGENWMNLFVNVGTDRSSGWEGYGYIVNRSRSDKTVSVSKFKEGFEAEKIGDAEYAINGEYMAVRIDKSLLGVEGEIKNLLFKWADNSTVSGDVMEFMDKGDAAPNDRYAYSYIGYEGETEIVTEEIKTEKATETEAPGTEKAQAEEEERKFPVIEIAAVAAAVIAVAAAVIIKLKKK